MADRSDDLKKSIAGASLLILAVPDDVLATLAESIADTGTVGPSSTVLHCSGLHGRSILAPLYSSGAALGSLHPLQTFTDPAGEPDALVGAAAVVEGDARAVEAARALAEALGMSPVVVVAASGKARYHAAAVFASNYLVVLADIAARLAFDAGIGDDADTIFLPLMQGTLAHLAQGDPAAALTGPIRRGDAGTVKLHLAALDGPARELYVALGKRGVESGGACRVGRGEP